MRKILCALIFSVFGVSCTDAQRGKILSLGGSASIKCYSGGVVIYEGRSTGKVSSESQSDGYYFVDKTDGKAREINADCVIVYD